MAGSELEDGSPADGPAEQRISLADIQSEESNRPRWLNGSRGKFRFVPPDPTEFIADAAVVQTTNAAPKKGEPQPLAADLPLPAIADIQTLLATAAFQAQQLQDERSQSFAVGMQGRLYEQLKDWPRARTLTQQALQQAQRLNAQDIAYQWQWQLGRILKHQAETVQPDAVSQDAIDQYSTAIQTLERLRSDLVALNPDVQFSFRETVEPVYRELVDLLLRAPAPPLAQQKSLTQSQAKSEQDSLQKSRLIQARDLLESLQLAELDNFFRDACAQPEAVNIDDLDPHTAVIYPILLPDRLEVVLKLPGKDNLQHYAQPVAADEVRQVARQMRSALTSGSDRRGLRRSSQQLYRWLIEPFEAALDMEQVREQSEIQTLTFVLDGPLRNLPMAALSKVVDGDPHYLVERYAIAITPGLQLLEPKPLLRENLKILLAGATDSPSFSQEGFAPLENVEAELKGIQALFQTSQLLDQEQFSQANIEANLAEGSFEIIHLATHGQFSSNPDQTFVLDWGDRISVNNLDDLLDTSHPNRSSPVEMLVLSACETAKGDDRAALGLAGVAIRAGARSTLATLWQVNDASTAEFMVRFYQELSRPELKKAEALRNAQLALIQNEQSFDEPYYWAPFILVGNWL